jgi:hypothetical protein
MTGRRSRDDVTGASGRHCEERSDRRNPSIRQQFLDCFVAEPAVPGIAEHIRKFWDPRMRSAILAHLNAGGAGLDPDVRDALEALKKA